MKLIIVRHGLTDFNAQGIMQGNIEKPLNKEGFEQASKVALRLKNEKISTVYSSNLSRAVETTKEILTYHPTLSAIYTPDIIERSYGIYDGKHRDIYLAAYKKEKVPYYKFKPAGGESVLEARDRALRFHSKIYQKHQQETVLMVSHGGFIRAFITGVLKESLENGKYSRHRQLNTAVTILNVNPGKVVVDTFNCVKHLE